MPLVAWAALPLASQGASPGARLDDLQRKIQTTQGKIGRRKGTERVLTTEIGAYSSKIGRLQGRIGRLQRRQSFVESDLDAKRSELERLQDDLRSERRRLVRLRARLHESRTALSARLVELYRADKPDLVTVIMSSEGFAELLERGEFMERVSEQDRRVVTLVRDARVDAIATERRLRALERRQRRITAIVVAHRNEIAAVKQDMIDTRVGLDGTRSDKTRALRTVRGGRHLLEREVRALQARQASIQATLQQAQGVLPAGPIKRGSGTMIWPITGTLTSPFCERRSWESCHPGIDIAAPAGTPIRAAATGKVALLQSVGQSGGYGNYTCVQHGGALSSCYAHQSGFATSAGASVTQGQVIGYVGNTGFSFGPHLHFEVRVNGAVTNPMAYL